MQETYQLKQNQTKTIMVDQKIIIKVTHKYQINNLRITTDLLWHLIEVRKGLNEIFKVLREKNSGLEFITLQTII